MSITVQLINIKDNSVLNNTFTVLIDEALSDTKERLFFYNKTFLPTFVKFIDSETSEVITPSKQFLNDYFQKNKKLYVTLLTDELENILNSYTLTCDTFYDKYKNDNESLDTIVTSLINDGYQLSKYYLFGAVLTVLNEKYSITKKEYSEFVTSTNKCYKFVEKKYKDRETVLKQFYDQCLQNNLTGYYQPNKPPPIHIRHLTLELKPTQTIQKQSMLKLKHIFNIFELSNDIPLIAFEENSNKPIVKIFNNINNDVSKKELSSWLTNEKISKGELSFYKKIKGLLLKIKRTKYMNYGHPLHATVIINDKGIITIILDFHKNEATSDINTILNDVTEYTKPCLQFINKYNRSSLEYPDSPIIKSITCSSDINKMINTDYIQKILLNKFFSENIFSVKTKKNACDMEFEEEEFEGEYEDEDEDQPPSEPLDKKDKKSKYNFKEISLYYKKYVSYDNPSSYKIRKPCSELVKLDSDKMGITVQIRDNLYSFGSIINICSANTINEVYAIINQIIFMNQLNKEVNDTINKEIKDKSRIKYIRDRFKTVGLNIEARSCVPIRQPSLDDHNEVDDTLVLKYKGLRIVCNDDVYKYPGFVGDKSICCFKNDKRNDKNYKANMEEMDDNYIYTSNYIISVKDKDGLTYTTYLLKMEDENDDNNYFFLNNKNDLVHIKNIELINKIENDINIKEDTNQSIWLNKILLTKLTEAHGNCKYQPDLKNKNENDINKPCSKHSSFIYFGYNKEGYPCCFDETQNDSNIIEEYVFNLKKMYIIKKEKILFSNQLGVLLPVFDKVFNTSFKTNIPNVSHGKYHRMGVYQNNSAFLNAISLSINKKEDSKSVKKEIVKYINDNPSVFDKLNNGDIRYKYKTLDNYIHWISNNKNVMNVYDLLHILHLVYNINIIIFNTPIIYNKTEQKIDEKNIKIICNSNCKPISENKYIVLFKRNDKYDVLVYNNEKDIVFSFSYQDSPLFQMFNDYYNQTCIIKKIYPEQYTNYNFDEFLDSDALIKSLDDTPYKITGQIMDNDKKVKMVISNKKILKPVKETVQIDNLPTYTDIALLSGDTYINTIQTINTILKEKGLTEIKIKGITFNKKGIVTNFGGYIVPILQQDKTTHPLLENVYPYNYYPMNDIIDKTTLNPEQSYNKENIHVQAEIDLIKKQLSYIIHNSKKLKNYILDKQYTNDNKLKKEYIQQSKFELINMYNTFFTQIINTMRTKYKINIQYNALYLSIISNEIIEDNVKNSFFNGIVSLHNFNTNEVKLQNNESLLLNVNDLQMFTKTHFKD